MSSRCERLCPEVSSGTMAAAPAHYGILRSMATETAGNPIITHGDDDEWVAATLTRIDANITELRAILNHQDGLIHEIHQALAPLRDHPEAVAKGLSLLDPGAGVRSFITGRKHKREV
jgi:hypothetical protein